MDSNSKLKNLRTNLIEQLVSFGENEISATVLCSNDQKLVVRSCAYTLPTTAYPWLSNRIVCHDKYGPRETARLDAVLLQSPVDDPTFGKLLHLFSTPEDIGAHDFAVVQLYDYTDNASPINALFGEVHLRLSDTIILYVAGVASLFITLQVSVA